MHLTGAHDRFDVGRNDDAKPGWAIAHAGSGRVRAARAEAVLVIRGLGGGLLGGLNTRLGGELVRMVLTRGVAVDQAAEPMS
jgi:hypothetical protein